MISSRSRDTSLAGAVVDRLGRENSSSSLLIIISSRSLERSLSRYRGAAGRDDDLSSLRMMISSLSVDSSLPLRLLGAGGTDSDR